MRAPRVSICIPAYEQPDCLRRVLYSIKIQSETDFEVVVTDDSSDNRVEEVVREFARAMRIIYRRNIARLGSPGNWNEALRLSSGKYVKFLHHDDWLRKRESLHAYVTMLENSPKADFAFSACAAHGPLQELKFIHAPTQKQLAALRRSPEVLFPTNFVGSPSDTIFRRNIPVYFDERLKWVVDIDFYIAVLNRNRHFVYCSEPLVCVTTGAHHQMTSLCEGDKHIEVFEWIYLFRKLQRPIPYLKQILFLWHLMGRHGIRRVSQLHDLGVERPIPPSLLLMVLLRHALGRAKMTMVSPGMTEE